MTQQQQQQQQRQQQQQQEEEEEEEEEEGRPLRNSKDRNQSLPSRSKQKQSPPTAADTMAGWCWLRMYPGKAWKGHQ